MYSVVILYNVHIHSTVYVFIFGAKTKKKKFFLLYYEHKDFHSINEWMLMKIHWIYQLSSFGYALHCLLFRCIKHTMDCSIYEFKQMLNLRYIVHVRSLNLLRTRIFILSLHVSIYKLLHDYILFAFVLAYIGYQFM